MKLGLRLAGFQSTTIVLAAAARLTTCRRLLYRTLSSQARAHRATMEAPPGVAVYRILEQASPGASSCLLLDTTRLPWAPAQAPRVARVAIFRPSPRTSGAMWRAKEWRAAGPWPSSTCLPQALILVSRVAPRIAGFRVLTPVSAIKALANLLAL